MEKITLLTTGKILNMTNPWKRKNVNKFKERNFRETHGNCAMRRCYRKIC